jgi:acyl-coenzyme A thioesterase PaaI-like protein
MPASPATETELNCFGCAPNNPIGLHMSFQPDGEGFVTSVKLGPDYESFPGIVHGGIIATILDELLAQAVYRLGRVSAFTTGLRIRYGRPMETDTEHVAHAHITAQDSVSVRASGRIELPTGDLVAAAEGTFCRITDDVLDSYGERIPGDLARILRAANGAIPQRG